MFEYTFKVKDNKQRIYSYSGYLFVENMNEAKTLLEDVKSNILNKNKKYQLIGNQSISIIKQDEKKYTVNNINRIDDLKSINAMRKRYGKVINLNPRKEEYSNLNEKIFKTWEVIKMLNDNPTLVFKCCREDMICRENVDTCIGVCFWSADQPIVIEDVNKETKEMKESHFWLSNSDNTKWINVTGEIDLYNFELVDNKKYLKRT